MECGNNFTHKLEGMFTDMKTNAMLLKDWEKSPQSKFGGNIEISVQVLTLNYWPFSNKNLQCILPQNLQEMMKGFFFNF